MSRLALLRTLGDVQRTRRAVRKRDLPTKLDRAIASKAARLLDKRKLDAWAFAVKTRDRWIDRRTGIKVSRTRSLDPLRAEAHHIASRDDRAVRYDVRNGLCLSLETHDAVERNRLTIIGTRFFTKRGTRYIDGRYTVLFRAG
jgi:hypothetical protein